jgi:hypothetical protein
MVNAFVIPVTIYLEFRSMWEGSAFDPKDIVTITEEFRDLVAFTKLRGITFCSIPWPVGL